MNIEVYAALRFRSASALEKGLAVFAATAHPDLFTRELWSVSGAIARCKRTLEVEAGLNYRGPFLTLALQATEGAVYLRVRGEKALVRIHRATKEGWTGRGGWINLTDDSGLHPFGTYVDWFEAAQAEAKSAALPAAKTAKSTARKRAASARQS